MVSGSAQFIERCKPEFIQTQSMSGCLAKMSAAKEGMAEWLVMSKTAWSTVTLELELY
jgi:hypothetical protein